MLDRVPHTKIIAYCQQNRYIRLANTDLFTLRSVIGFILETSYYNRTVIVEITHKTRTSFKKLASKKATTWLLKKSQSHNSTEEIGFCSGYF